ncbi:hypothetical protein SCHPADRAFT_910876, partial [Schizopora paradoxa]
MSRHGSPNHTSTFYQEDTGIRLKCQSASDVLLASLVLKKDDIDIGLFNDFLSIIHDPTFDPKDVSFKTTGDIFAHLARVREEDMFHLVNTKASLPSSEDHQDLQQTRGPMIPPIAVELAIDALRDEMVTVAFEYFHPRGNTMLELDDDDYGGRRRPQRPHLSTLFNCSLVHSSWLPQARRAAGIFLQNAKHGFTPLMQFIQNPCFGQWTRSLHLAFRESYLPSDHVGALFDLIPNITFLCLEFQHKALYEDVAYAISEHISRRLRRLDELLLSLNEMFLRGEEDQQRKAFTKLLAFPGGFPSLKSLRLSGLYVDATFDPPFFLGYKLLTTAPNLTHIQVETPISNSYHLPRDGRPISLSWVKHMDAKGATFVPDRIHHWGMTTGEGLSDSIPEPAANRDFYSRIKSLWLEYASPEEPEFEQGLQRLKSFVRSCSAITTLDLCLPFAGGRCCDAALKALASMSDTVETLHIHIQFLWLNFTSQKFPEPRERFDRIDELLANSFVSLETKSSNLRMATLHFEISDYDWAEHKVEDIRLPRTTKWCKRRLRVFEIRLVVETNSNMCDRLRYRIE